LSISGISFIIRAVRGRGEATKISDIDPVVILDALTPSDITP
jgi:hypothetical protein